MRFIDCLPRNWELSYESATVWHLSEADLLKDMELRKQKEGALVRCGISDSEEDSEDEDDTPYCHECEEGEGSTALSDRACC